MKYQIYDKDGNFLGVAHGSDEADAIKQFTYNFGDKGAVRAETTEEEGKA